MILSTPKKKKKKSDQTREEKKKKSSDNPLGLKIRPKKKWKFCGNIFSSPRIISFSILFYIIMSIMICDCILQTSKMGRPRSTGKNYDDAGTFAIPMAQMVWWASRSTHHCLLVLSQSASSTRIRHI